MGNCQSTEHAQIETQGHNLDTIEIIKNVCQTLLLAKRKLPDMVYSSKYQWSEDRLKTTLDDVNELCEK